MALKLAKTRSPDSPSSLRRRRRDLRRQERKTNAHPVSDLYKRDDLAGQVIQRGVVRRRAGEGDIPGIEDERGPALGFVRGNHDVSTFETKARQAVRAGLRRARKDVGPGEFGHERIRGRAQELRRRADLTEPALDQDTDSIGECGRVLEVMRDEQRRQLELAEKVVQLRPHLAARVRIERSHRLVEQEHARVPRERASNGDSLPLASGKLGRLCLRKVLDTQTP